MLRFDFTDKLTAFVKVRIWRIWIFKGFFRVVFLAPRVTETGVERALYGLQTIKTNDDRGDGAL